MLEQITIPKLPNSSFPEHLSFEYLRKQGLQHIERLGSKIWTDYNIHDPGVTILEVLCYALTDLGYRTRLDIKDLLMMPKDGIEDNFFSPAQILTCNPVTITDFRKLLIDLPGVKNAWFEVAESGEIAIYLNNKVKEEEDLTARLEYDKSDQKLEYDDSDQKIDIRGLYNVCIEFDKELSFNDCGQPIDRRAETLEHVQVTLNAHRNLCEDFKDVLFFDEEGIAICADIDLEATADVNEVMLEIYKGVEAFLSPNLRFYTLQELLDKGKAIEEIYEGRPIKTKSHGFIDTEELAKLTPKKKLYASDLMQVIMDIEGIKAIRKFYLVNYIDELPRTKGEPWCIHLSDKYLPHFDFKHSAINFYKGVLPQFFDENTVKRRYLEEKLASNKSLLNPYDLDLEVPKGTFRADLGEFTSIQNDFPLTYGIGEEGIRGIASKERKAQAKQLKAYLLFFDQILANYLSQLANVRSLFSLSPTNGKFITGQGTYTSQSIANVVGAKELLLNPNNCQTENKDNLPPDDYLAYLHYITENEDSFYQRKNDFLDHLLARFGESFSEYVLLLYEADGTSRNQAKIVEDKMRFLQDYPTISRERGKAFDYTKEQVWDTDNVSGLEKRVNRLLGIEDRLGENLSTLYRKTLAPIEKREVAGGYVYQFKNEEGENEVLLQSKQQYKAESDAQQAAAQAATWLGNSTHYRRLTCIMHNKFGYCIRLVDEEGAHFELLGKGEVIASSCEEINEIIEAIGDLLKTEDVVGRIDECIEARRDHAISVGLEPIDSIDDTSNTYRIIVKKEEEVIFYGEKSYENCEVASDDLDAVVAQLQAIKYYCTEKKQLDTLAKYSFLLVNDSGEPIAESPKTYSTAEERNSAIQNLISQALFGTEIACTALQEEENCYFYQLQHYANETILLKSQSGYESEAQAQAAFEEGMDALLEKARDVENYSKVEEEAGFSFKLNGTAYHTRHYTTPPERDYWMQMVFYYLNDPLIAEPIIDGTIGEFQFEIKQGDQVVFLGKEVYQTQLDAHKAARRVLRLLAKYRLHYHLLDQDGNAPFGFELLDRGGEVIATHPPEYTTDCERDLAVDNLIYCLNNELPEADLEPLEGLYFFILKEEEEQAVNPVLIRSVATFETTEAAQSAWTAFLELAQNIEHYEPIQTAEGYSFQINNAAKEPIAVHPNFYTEEAERDMALQAVFNRFCFTQFDIGTAGINGSLKVRLALDLEFDDKDEAIILLESVQTYADHVKAQEAFLKIIELAEERANFTPPIDDNETLSIRLNDLNGDLFAASPIEFGTRGEREAFLEMLIAYVRSEKVKSNIVNETGAFYVEIRDGIGEQILLTGTEILPSKEAVEIRQSELLALAKKYSNYVTKEVENSPCPYRIELQDGAGDIVATHPKKYVSEEERDFALFEIFIYLTDGKSIAEEVVVPILGYRFVAQTSDASIVLKSVKTYEVEEYAFAAFEVFEASDKERYTSVLKDDLYAIQILDKAGQILAEQPPTYASEAEAEAAKQELFFDWQVRGATYQFRKDEAEQYQIVLQSENSDFLVTEYAFADEAAAKIALLEILHFAGKIEQYEKVTTGEEDCHFGFLLKDTAGDVVAQAARSYPDEASRDAAIEQYVAHQTTLEAPVSVASEILSYTYKIRDFRDNLLIESKEKFTTEAAAKAHYLNTFLPLAQNKKNYRLDYDNEQCKYTFKLLDASGNEIGVYNDHFLSRSDRMEHIEYIIALLSEYTVNSQIEGSGCAYYFTLDCGDEKELQSQQFYPSQLMAERACNSLKPELLKSSNYEFVDGYVEFKVDGQLILKSTQKVEEGFIETFIQKLENTQIEIAIQDNSSDQVLQCVLLKNDQLKDCESEQLEKELLLTEHLVEANSEQTACGLCNEMLESLQERDNVCLITDEDACYYSFNLVNEAGETIAVHNNFYDSKSKRNQAIECTMKVANTEGMHLLEHVLLRPRNEGYIPLVEYGFTIQDEEGIYLKSLSWETNKEDVLHHLKIFVEKLELVHKQLKDLKEEKKEIEDKKESGYQEKVDKLDEEIQLLVSLKDKGTTIKQDCEEVGKTVKQLCIKELDSIDLWNTNSYIVDAPTDNEKFLDLLIEIFNNPYLNLHHFIEKICPENISKEYRIEVAENQTVLLNSKEAFSTMEETLACLEQLRDTVLQFDDSTKLEKEIELVKGENETIHIVLSESLQNDKNNWDKLKKVFSDEAINLSHSIIQVCPEIEKEAADQLMKPIIEGSSLNALTPRYSDPYSFRATVVLPYWTKRFQNWQFRSFVEQTLRREAPAHVYLRICWIDACQMLDFEKAYREWLEAQQLGVAGCNRTDKLNALIDVLSQLKNIYPEANLFACETETAENPIVLNHTVLGSAS
ncbi:MAG: hypothetical protein AAGG68_20660 [Bacteroidota bacterium]